MTSSATGLLCTLCQRLYDPARRQFICETCGQPLLQQYDYDSIDLSSWQRPWDLARGVWNHSALLPEVGRGQKLSLGEACTPLIPLSELGRELELQLYVKDESQNPTGTFKSRGAAVAVSTLRALGITSISLPTIGNGGSAWAAYCARGGVELTVRFSADLATPTRGRLEPPLYGARVVTDDQPVEQGPDRPQEAGAFAEPFRVEGDKTLLFETWQQLQAIPDVIVWPTAGGVGAVATAKAFVELKACGLPIEKELTIVLAQPAGGAPFVDAIDTGSDFLNPARDEPRGVAPGIWPGPVKYGQFVLDYLRRESELRGAAVTDEAIKVAWSESARREGLMLGPEGAAGLAAVYQLAKQGSLKKRSTVVIVNTSSSLRYEGTIEEPKTLT